MTKKQMQVDLGIAHVDCLSEPREKIDGMLREKFDLLLKSVSI